MIPYYLVFSIIFLFQIRFYKDKRFVCIFLFVLLFLFAILRGNGDGDYFTYLNYSKAIKSFSDIFNFRFPMEIGFRIISYFVNLLKLYQQFVIIIMNSISIGLIYRFVKKRSIDPMLSIWLYIPMFLQYDMHATRTAIAYAILTLAYEQLLNKRNIGFVTFFCLAMCFHQSSVIFLIVYVINKISINKIFMLYSTIIVYMLVSFINVDKLITSITTILGFKDLAIRYNEYVNSVEFGYSFSLFDPRLLLNIFILFLAISAFKNYDEENNLLLKIQWILVLVIIVFSEHTIFVTRFSSFFSVYGIVFYPNLLNIIKRKYPNAQTALYFKYGLIIIYSIQILVLLNKYVPYRLFL